jgi:glutamate-1-semialdehyde 2,1-aminomutase
LQKLREITRSDASLLIFDEVMTGFRVAFGGAQELYSIKPDLTTLGKIIGGGLPVGAYGGRADLMRMIAPLGPVYQAGTLSGNPLAMAAGVATLRRLLRDRGRIYAALDRNASDLVDGISEAARESGIKLTSARVGSMFTWFFRSDAVSNYEDAVQSDTTTFAQFHRGMLERGIYLPPSQFEAAFLSAAHTSAEIERTIDAAHSTFKTFHHSAATSLL